MLAAIVPLREGLRTALAENADQPGQEFVVGGYKFGANTFDALVFGDDDGDRPTTRGERVTAVR